MMASRKKLTIDNLREVRKALFEISSKWYDLGIELNIRHPTLENIKSLSNDSGDNLRDLLQVYLKELCPTWEDIVEALRSEPINNLQLAEKISRKYCTNISESENDGEIDSADRDTKKLVADLRKRISQLESELVQIKSREAHSKLKESLSITREFYKDYLFCQQTIPVTNKGATYKFEGAGMKFIIPENALPEKLQQGKVDIEVVTENIGNGHQLVSPVYRIYPKGFSFQKDVRIEIQHAAINKQSLFFVQVEDNSQCVKQLDNGKFSKQSDFGVVAKRDFSGFAIAAPQGTQMSMLSRVLYQEDRAYGHLNSIAFIITLNLEILLSLLNSEFEHWQKGPLMPIQFEGSQIMMDIPPSGIEKDGFKIIPVIPPVITKDQVMNMLTSSAVKFPVCHLNVVRKPGYEFHQDHGLGDIATTVHLIGASAPNDYIIVGQKIHLYEGHSMKFKLNITHVPFNENSCSINISISESSIMSMSQRFYKEELSLFTVTQDVKFIGKSISICLPLTLGNWELKALNHPEIQFNSCTQASSIYVIKILAKRKAGKKSSTLNPLNGKVFLEGAAAPYNYFIVHYDSQMFHQIRQKVISMPPVGRMFMTSPTAQSSSLLPMKGSGLVSASDLAMEELKSKKSSTHNSVTEFSPEIESLLSRGNFAT